MSKIIKVRKGDAADKPILNLGEFGWDLDTEELFIGGNNGNVRIGVGVIANNVVINIPTDYPTLQEAIDNESKKPYKQGVNIELRVESGHNPSSGIHVENGDYGRFSITSVDATLILDNLSGYFISGINAIMPVMDCYVDGGGVTDRLYSAINSIGQVAENGGGENCVGRILYCNNSNILAGTTTWKNFGDSIYCSTGMLKFGNSVIDGATVSSNGSLTISRGGRCEAQRMTIKNSVRGIEVKRAGSSLNAHECVVENLTGTAITITRGGTVSVDDSVFSNLFAQAVECRSGVLSATNTQFLAGLGNSNVGVQISNGSNANIAGASSVIRAFGVQNLLVENAFCNAENVLCENAGGTGVSVTENARLNFRNATSRTSGSGVDVACTVGSTIALRDATTSTGNPAVADTNVAAFNAIDGANGIIYA